MSLNIVKKSLCHPALYLAVLVFADCWSYSFHARPVDKDGRIVQVKRAQFNDMSGVKMVPVDEASKDPSFEDFRWKLRQAMMRRDVDFLLKTIDPNIRLSLGGDRGLEAFTERWHPEKSDSKVWTTLDTILSLGGTFERVNGETRFCAPYVTTRWQVLVKRIPELANAYEYTVVLGKNVRIHSKPNADSPVLDTLSFNVLKLSQPGVEEQTGWVKVKMPHDGVGYINAKDVRSPLDYNACFKQVDGRWMMVSFLAGD